jgi:hypothetical protein
VTYPEEVEETIGTPIEVEPLDQTQLDEIGLNTCSHNLSLSSKEVLSFDEPEPQPNPLPNLPSLDESLRIEKGPDPPIKPYSPSSLGIKLVDSKICREEADIGVNHDVTYLHHPFVTRTKTSAYWEATQVLFVLFVLIVCLFDLICFRMHVLFLLLVDHVSN